MGNSMVTVKWAEKRLVAVLTTIHSDEVVVVERRTRLSDAGHEVIQKPKAIVEYNQYMGGVDRADQFLSYYRFSHCTVKWYWWRHAFSYLFDLVVVISYVVGGPAVPPDQLSPWTAGPRTSCPGGHPVLGRKSAASKGCPPQYNKDT
jgi:hypothetical protein